MSDRQTRHCAIVTGANGGIGMAFVKELLARGCQVIMVDLNGERLSEMSESLGRPGDILTLELDLTRKDAAERLFEFCDSGKCDPDILINNAGIFSFRPVCETSAKTIDTFVDLHVRAVTVLSKEFAGRRLKKGSGYILNMSSMSCWMPMPGIALYAATKAYIRVFTRALHYELKDYGVNAMAACPGGIATNLFGLSPSLTKLALRLGAIARPEKFAHKAIRKLLKGEKQYINGFINRISIFFVGITPDWMRMLVKHKMLDRGIRR